MSKRTFQDKVQAAVRSGKLGGIIRNKADRIRSGLNADSAPEKGDAVLCRLILKNAMIYEEWRDGNGQYRWRLKGRNGRIITGSGAESYKRLPAMRKSVGLAAAALAALASSEVWEDMQ